MQLTLFTDYCFRVLIYLAQQPQRRVTVTELSDYYGISRHHLVKVVHWLGRQGYVTTSRGKQGGLCLARAAKDINIGQVARATEPGFDLVECFDAATNTCRILPHCGLTGVLMGATRAFLAELDRYTLADLSTRPLPARPGEVRLRPEAGGAREARTGEA
jgi:Rrf2 family nitric oxide-sensitive transcriptional repressor